MTLKHQTFVGWPFGNYLFKKNYFQQKRLFKMTVFNQNFDKWKCFCFFYSFTVKNDGIKQIQFLLCSKQTSLKKF
jgi:hypothetical protein